MVAASHSVIGTSTAARAGCGWRWRARGRIVLLIDRRDGVLETLPDQIGGSLGRLRQVPKWKPCAHAEGQQQPGGFLRAGVLVALGALRRGLLDVLPREPEPLVCGRLRDAEGARDDDHRDTFQLDQLEHLAPVPLEVGQQRAQLLLSFEVGGVVASVGDLVGAVVHGFHPPETGALAVVFQLVDRDHVEPSQLFIPGTGEGGIVGAQLAQNDDERLLDKIVDVRLGRTRAPENAPHELEMIPVESDEALHTEDTW